jgi:hypothetical protein
VYLMKICHLLGDSRICPSDFDCAAPSASLELVNSYRLSPGMSGPSVSLTVKNSMFPL